MKGERQVGRELTMGRRLLFGLLCLALVFGLGPVVAQTAEAQVAEGLDSSEGGFHISQWTGEAWEEVYQHAFQAEYSTEEFVFKPVDGRVSLRIVQLDTPFADVDQIRLAACGVDLTPEYAEYTIDRQSILDDIIEIDHNVVLAHEREIEISWETPGVCDEATLYLTANEYGHGSPLEFPWDGYSTYEMGSNPGSLTVDGLIGETEGASPQFSPFWKPSSGHPDGHTYIFIYDDPENLYFALDITSDNTNEYGEDWAELILLEQDGTQQRFRVDDFNATWGRFGFGLTSRASYKHQTGEFSIPKAVIGNDTVQFKLVYYGTAMTLWDHGDAPDTYSTKAASKGARHLVEPGFMLGKVIDAELDGQPSPLADGDDINPRLKADDEDGVTWPAALKPGGAANVTVFLTSGPGGGMTAPMESNGSGGMLDAWVDFNIDGDFLDPGEQIFLAVLLKPGPNLLAFPVPAGATPGSTYARFRLSWKGGLPPFGSAPAPPEGEVEDYLVDIKRADIPTVPGTGTWAAIATAAVIGVLAAAMLRRRWYAKLT